MVYIEHIQGDLFTTKSDVIIHGVNTKGVMGGIAGIIARKYPIVKTLYQAACEEGLLVAGGFFPVPTLDGKLIVNVVSQINPGADAKLEYLQEGLEHAYSALAEENISLVAMPRIGTGIGGLDWAEAEPVIAGVANKYKIHTEVWFL